MASIPRAYPKNMSSLNGLELTCETDEADLAAKLTSLALGKDDGTDVTAASYEEVDGVKLGHLAFEQYETDVDEQSLKAIHQTKGDTFLFKGEAYVQNNPVKVLVFREK